MKESVSWNPNNQQAGKYVLQPSTTDIDPDIEANIYTEIET